MKDDVKKELHTPYIIEAKGNVTMPVRIRDAVLTLLLWVAYLYLLHDFYIFLGDIYDWLHDGIGPIKAYPKLRIFHVMQTYAEGLLLVTVVFISWALYNKLRFRNSKRRTATEPVTTNDLHELFGLRTIDLDLWQQKRSLTVHHDKNGYVSKVDVIH
jgi:poly-beta-1,6-N-acetyl-D-glucosamine biosynthesis protein PgaD